MELLAIISLVVSVLNIILFFKIWGMTNDVNAIRQGLSNNIDLSCLATGNEEDTKKLLASMFVGEVKVYADLASEGKMESETIKKAVSNIASKYQNKAKVFGVNIDFEEIGGNILNRLEVLLDSRKNAE